MQVIKYKGQLYKRVDASDHVVEKLQSIIEKRLNSAVDLLHVRGLKFYLKKEQVSENRIAFYVTVDLKSTNNAADLTDKQKHQIVDQLEELLLKGLRPLVSMEMFKEHELSVTCYKANANRIQVCSLKPDASKGIDGTDNEKSAANGKLFRQFNKCEIGLGALSSALAALVKEEDSFNGSFEKNIGGISALAPKLAAELKHTFANLTKSAKEANVKLEKANKIVKASAYGNLDQVKEAVKELQAL